MKRARSTRVLPGVLARLGWRRTRYSLHCLALVLSVASWVYPLSLAAKELQLTPGGTLRFDGNATLGDWACASHDLQGRFHLPMEIEEIEAFFDFVSTGSLDRVAMEIRDLRAEMTDGTNILISVFVPSLNCGNRAMERDLHNALRAESFPQIEYRFELLAGMSPLDVPDLRGVLLHTEGSLSVAGTSRYIVMDVSVHRDKVGVYHLVGRKEILMSDFGVTPPSAFLGLIQAHNQVEIIFDVHLKCPHVTLDNVRHHRDSTTDR